MRISDSIITPIEVVHSGDLTPDEIQELKDKYKAIRKRIEGIEKKALKILKKSEDTNNGD